MKQWVKPMLALIGFAALGVIGGLFFAAHDPLANGFHISAATAKSLGVWGSAVLIPIPLLAVFSWIEKRVGHARVAVLLDFLLALCIVFEIAVLIVLVSVR